MPALCPRTYPVSSLKHVLRFLLIAEMLLVLMTACSSSAKVVNVTTCSGADLAAAFREANRTPEPDTLELNGECTYLLTAIVGQVDPSRSVR
jgi:hypothetical protein